MLKGLEQAKDEIAVKRRIHDIFHKNISVNLCEYAPKLQICTDFNRIYKTITIGS